ncbi:alpha/beta fold hydrolase [Paenibacillus sp. JJ-223]|uniref:alpha/beta fold hydrolase n=1 Tax=Paenibacillus sp. JJ-223 TaxID=2905647 RepID=UPI001F42E348|nr:alpha/beta fold hydrolase [Paenibacillus sp. JJ-223]CAH1207489.1 Proline iminopeptidase [Paenibacillus sp. JJ-223]
MSSSLFSIRGTRLFVEQYNEPCEEVLLYLHGGPGASCVDFCYFQAEALSDSLRVIAIDQRGVLRSDPIQANEHFGLNDIIEDLEELRKQMGIRRWSVLGHSFGGYLAVKYALSYPESIHKVIFETPCFDVKRATRSIISKAKEHFIHVQNQPGIEASNEYLHGNYKPNELWNALGDVFQLLGEDKNLLYFRQLTTHQYDEIMQSQASSNDMWSKNQVHSQKLQEEGLFFENLLPKLSGLTQPTLLLAGAYDPVCCGEQQRVYLEKVQDGRLVMFDRSAHFPRLEEPEKYTIEVLNFIFS